MKTIILLISVLFVKPFLGQELRSFEENGKYGYKNDNEEVVVQTLYESVKYFFTQEDSLVAVKLNGKFGFIDRSGNQVIEFKFQDAYDFGESGFASVKLKEKWGLINFSGKEVVSCKYDWIGPFKGRSHSDLFLVDLNGKTGVVDKTGAEVLPIIYSNIWEYYDVPFLVSKDRVHFGLLDLSGKEVLPLKYEGHFPGNSLSKSGYEPIKIDDKWGYLDSLGTIQIPLKYDQAFYFTKNLAAVKQNGKYGFIDKSGDMVIPFKYDEVKNFSVGFAAVKLKDKWGFIDIHGNEVIPIQYDQVKDFSSWSRTSNDKSVVVMEASVTVNGRTFTIDNEGNEIKE